MSGHPKKLVDWEVYLSDPVAYYTDGLSTAIGDPIQGTDNFVRGLNRTMQGASFGLLKAVTLLPTSIHRAATKLSLTHLGDVPKMCAHVASECYKLPQSVPLGNGESRRIQRISGMVSSGIFELVEDTHFKNRYFAVYLEHSRKLAILGYTGTRFGTDFFWTDIATDANVLCAQASDPYFIDVLSAVSERVSRQHSDYTLIVAGHSLGGTRALMASYHPSASNSVRAVHVFNAGAGIGADPRQQQILDDVWQDPNIFRAYARGVWSQLKEMGSMFQIGDGQAECPRTCHHIFGDVISMLNTKESHMEVITYQKHPQAPDRHSIVNFTL